MIRVGNGYDIHRTAPGNSVTLGGIAIPAPYCLDGYSDADVIVHALMDALLGACGLPDIGHHFPPGDAAWERASSLDLLGRVAALVVAAGFRVINVDSVLVAEEPRIGPHIDAMKARIARALDLDPRVIGIKATTHERVGPEGRLEAVSALAVALVETR